MKVLQVAPIMSWTGGMQEYIAGITRGLVDAGHEVVIIAGGHGPLGGSPTHPLAHDLQIEWHPRVPIAGRYLYPSGIYHSLRAYSAWADVVHAHQPFAVGTVLAALQRTPLAATLYLHPEQLSGRNGWRHRAQLRLLLRRIDLVVGLSSAELALIRDVRLPKKACVVWPGAEATRVRAEKPPGAPLVLCVGRLHPSKRVDLAIRAVAQLNGLCELAVVGEGPERDSLIALCADVGLDAQRVLLGDVDEAELDDLFRQAAALIAMSAEEAFGIAVLKALANRCKVVVTDIASHREIVSELGVSLDALVPVHATIDDVAQALRRALNAPRLPDRVVDAVPTWSDSAATLGAQYAGLLDHPAP